ncbi:MAG: EVE domain-containing protein [Desulfovibrionaceae bacterium]
MNYWLFKSETECFSVYDLQHSPDQRSSWDGVRNYQARNFMRDHMKLGDLGLFYHSGKHPEIAGIVEICRESYPDHTAQDSRNEHFDPAASPENPRWFMVDVRLVRVFKPSVPRPLLRECPELAGMELLKLGCRLSVMPVREQEFIYITHLADSLAV